MRIGKLRNPIAIEQQSAGTPDAYGEVPPETPWTTFAPAWASIEPISARESEHAKRFAATVDHKVTIRYVPGVKTKHRVRFGSRLLFINGITNTEERNRELVLYCTEAGT